MRHELAPLWRKAGAARGRFHSPLEHGKRIGWRHPRPQRMRPALALEMTDAAKSKREWGGADRGESVGNILSLMGLDLAEKSQGQMELALVLPARARDTTFQRQQVVDHIAWRADGGEQAVKHRVTLPRRPCYAKQENLGVLRRAVFVVAILA